jgi:hypothetical protein
MSDIGSEKINKKGFLAGIVSWVIIIIFAINQGSCVNYHGCDSGDLFLMSIIAVGMIAPAYLIAITISIFSGGNK